LTCEQPVSLSRSRRLHKASRAPHRTQFCIFHRGRRRRSRAAAAAVPSLSARSRLGCSATRYAPLSVSATYSFQFWREGHPTDNRRVGLSSRKRGRIRTLLCQNHVFLLGPVAIKESGPNSGRTYNSVVISSVFQFNSVIFQLCECWHSALFCGMLPMIPNTVLFTPLERTHRRTSGFTGTANFKSKSKCYPKSRRLLKRASIIIRHD
jgi:hypothetical protein